MTEFKEINFIKNIKSNYVIKRIFSFLNKKQFLDLIIYNKELQQIFGVNIKDYIKLSEKYMDRIYNENNENDLFYNSNEVSKYEEQACCNNCIFSTFSNNNILIKNVTCSQCKCNLPFSSDE